MNSSSRAMLYKLAPAEAKNNQEEKTSLGTPGMHRYEIKCTLGGIHTPSSISMFRNS